MVNLICFLHVGRINIDDDDVIYFAIDEQYDIHFFNIERIPEYQMSEPEKEFELDESSSDGDDVTPT